MRATFTVLECAAGLFGFLFAGCTVGAGPTPVDAYVMPPPLDAFTTPTPSCGADAGAFEPDPCARWVSCQTGTSRDAGYLRPWALTYTNGTCVAGRCAFTEPPSIMYCATTCFIDGPYGRCERPGPTAP